MGATERRMNRVKKEDTRGFLKSCWKEGCMNLEAVYIEHYVVSYTVLERPVIVYVTIGSSLSRLKDIGILFSILP